MNSPPPLSRAQDEAHLDALAIAHYVLGGVTALFALLPLLHFTIGLTIATCPECFAGKGGTPPPAILGWALAAFGGFLVLLGETYALCLFLAGRSLRQRRRYVFCFVIACVSCMLFPFGTALGVFSIIVVSRESVKTLFAGPAQPPAP